MSVKLWATPADACPDSPITASISFNIFPVAPDSAAVRAARERISPATTAKPRPASPACAASIAAFIASKFVRPEISTTSAFVTAKPRDRLVISSITSIMRPTHSLPVLLAVVIASKSACTAENLPRKLCTVLPRRSTASSASRARSPCASICSSNSRKEEPSSSFTTRV